MTYIEAQTHLVLNKELPTVRVSYQVLHREKQQFRPAGSSSLCPLLWAAMPNHLPTGSRIPCSSGFTFIFAEAYAMASKIDFHIALINKRIDT